MNRKARKMTNSLSPKGLRKAAKKVAKARKRQLRQEFKTAMDAEIRRIKSVKKDQKAIRRAIKASQKAIKQAYKNKGM